VLLSLIFYVLGVDFIGKAVNLPGVKLFSPMAATDDVVTSYGVVTIGKCTITSAATDSLKIGPGPKGFVANFAYKISKHRCYERETDGLVGQMAF